MSLSRFFLNLFKIAPPENPHKEEEACCKAQTLLSSWGVTLTDLLEEVESAESENQVRESLDKFNDVMLCFLSAFDLKSRLRATQRCLLKLGSTDTLSSCLTQGATLREALQDYKEKAITKMNLMLKRRAKERIITQMEDFDLYERLFNSARTPLQFNWKKRRLDQTEVSASEKINLLDQKSLRPKKKVRNKRRKFKKKEYHFLKQNGICFSYQLGNCVRGERCKYKHRKVVTQ